MLQLQRPGFTIIEAIMVVSVIGIVATIGGPKVSLVLQRRSTASGADQFVVTHSLTRSTALVTGGSPSFISMSQDSDSG